MDKGWFSELTLGSAKEPEARAKGPGPLACQSDQDVLEANLTRMFLRQLPPCGPKPIQQAFLSHLLAWVSFTGLHGRGT